MQLGARQVFLSFVFGVGLPLTQKEYVHGRGSCGILCGLFPKRQQRGETPLHIQSEKK